MSDEILCPRCNAANPRDAVDCVKCGTKMPAPKSAEEQDPLLGAFVGERFMVERKLGEGGMGVVYEADQTAIDRKVALKVLHPNLTDESLYARFRNEAASCSKLSSPNTVTIYDFGKTETGSLYIAMEYIQGISLDDEIRDKGALDWQRACRIGIQICGSLQEAHEQGIVHRDLKPENVMLSSRGSETDVVKVLDFGIAKILEDDGKDQRQALTKTGMVFGTPQYMSPEQVRGETVDARSDIYSTGIIIYQMLTGEIPFKADTPMGLLTKHLMDTPPPLRDMNPNVQAPPELEEAVMRTLAKEADQRPQSMKELGDLMRAALGQAPTEQMAAAVAGGVAPTVRSDAMGAPLPGTVESSTPMIANEPPPKKANVGMIVGILVGGLVFFGGGGAAAWYFLLGPGAQKPATQQSPQDQPPLGQPPLGQPPLGQPPVVPPAQQGTAGQPTMPVAGDQVATAGQPTGDQVEALPAIPTEPPPEDEGSSSSGKKSGSGGGGGAGGGLASKLAGKNAPCVVVPKDSNAIAKAFAVNMNASQTAIQGCSSGKDRVGSIISYTLEDGSKKPSGLMVKTNQGGAASCLKKIVGNALGKKAKSRYTGNVAFEIQRAAKGRGPVTKCVVAISAKGQKSADTKADKKKKKKKKKDK